MTVNMADSVCFPSKLFKKKFSVGLDGGSSCFKFVYTTEEGDNLRFNFVMIPKNDRQKAWELLAELCAKANIEPGTELSVCGATNNIYMEELKKLTKLKFCTRFEFGMMTKAFQFLSVHQQWEDFVSLPSDKAKNVGRNNAISYQVITQHIHKSEPESKLPEAMDVDIRELKEPRTQLSFPTLLYLCGSAPAAIKVDADGRYEFVHWQPIGGRTLLALGYHSTGARTFEDLHALAKAGDDRKLHAFADTKVVGSHDSAYSFGDTSLIVFNFGQMADDPEVEVKKEDMSAGLFSTVINNVARDAYLMACRLKVKQTFFCGGLVCASDLTRDLFSTEYVYNCQRHVEEDSSDHYFIKYGAYLGAIGCLLTNLGMV